ncbi:MAG: AbrB/MazE/SpoVT family DNA-binding domain-containing protein [Gemmatimonadota bacterium]|nr:AbrB/MazE/SpoVT family DNA-binding domain-containing protein [Gemmatimonadota bacterium]
MARIGNSRGVRIPADTLERYEIGTSLIMEERSDGILLRPPGSAQPKLSWEDTARAMAASGEDWSEWDTLAADGLEVIPWQVQGGRLVAEKGTAYDTGRPRKK